jgi:hypothetical protein
LTVKVRKALTVITSVKSRGLEGLGLGFWPTVSAATKKEAMERSVKKKP